MTDSQNHEFIVIIRRSLLAPRAASLPQGIVEQAMYLGSEVEYMVTPEGKQLVVVDSDPQSDVFREGQQVGVAFVPEALHLLPAEDAQQLPSTSIAESPVTELMRRKTVSTARS